MAEPTYGGADHAAINAGLLQAIGQVAGPVVFASTAGQRAAILEADARALDGAECRDIRVMEPGGVHLRRMAAQWRALSGLVAAHRPELAVLLSAGPETLFVARGLAMRHPRLRQFVVMHGNLATATGWRSRDPRRRLIDLNTGLRLARHPRIRLVVLEDHIRTAALHHGLAADFLVWPHTVLAGEAGTMAPWQPSGRLRIAWVGTANRRKGFEDYLALHRHNAARHDWLVVGRPGDEFDPAALAGLDIPAERLDRAAFLARLRRADYAFMAFRSEYELTASGSLLDCINQRKPILAVRNAMLEGLARRHGPIGHLCDDLAGVRALLEDGAALRDPARYAGFQRALDAIAHTRLPQALAATMREHLA